MLVKMLPAKRVKINGKMTTVKVKDSPIEYFCPSLEDIKSHLSKEDSFKFSDPESLNESDFDSGLPSYSDPISSWIQSALNSAAQVKARGGFEVKGETSDTLKVVIGDIPQSFEDLITSDQRGGPYLVQKAAFLLRFKEWAEDGNINNPAQWLRVLSLSTLVGVSTKIANALEKGVQKFIDSLPEDEEEIAELYGVYLNALNRQLNAEKEEQDWSIPD